MLKCLRFYDVKEFFTKSENFLLQFEAENNLLLGTLIRQSKIDNNNMQMYQIFDTNILCGIAIVNNNNLILTKLDERQIHHLQETLIQDNIIFNSIESNIITGEYFAETWANRDKSIYNLFHKNANSG